MLFESNIKRLREYSESSMASMGLNHFEDTYIDKVLRRSPKISQSPGVHALHNRWHGEYDGFYFHAMLCYMAQLILR